MKFYHDVSIKSEKIMNRKNNKKMKINENLKFEILESIKSIFC